MIILTGGAGFIGSCLLKKLNSEGIDDIIVVDSLGETNKWKNLNGKKFIRYVEKNDFLVNIKSFLKSFEGKIDAIFHMGACSRTTEKNVDYLLFNNFDYSIALAGLAHENGIRFIYASSAATYGNGTNGYNDTIFDGLEPMNPYGFSKHQFDLWVLKNGFADEFTGLKFFNVYGPNEYHKDTMASMVFKSFNKLMETGKIKLFKSGIPEYKDGEQMRDFIYVKDVVDVMWQIYLNNKINGIMNLGTGQARTWNDLAKAVFKAAGKDTNIEYIDMPDELKNQYQYFTQADMQSFRKVFPDFSFTSIEDGVYDYLKNYLLSKNKYL